MSYLPNKNKKITIHLIFLFILSLYYLIPYFLVGELILKSTDLLDSGVVYNHIIGRIYRGDFESLNLFIAGEFKWYFLQRILQPLTLLYGFLETETAYWLTDILFKVIYYSCFFKLSKKLNATYFNSALIACLLASCIIPIYTLLGIGIATFPYLIYLVLKNKHLKLKHYFFLILIGLNTDLAFDMFILPMLFFVTLILKPVNQAYNFKLFFKIAFILIIFIFLSNSQLIYAQLFSEPLHRTEFIYETNSIMSNFNKLIRGFISIPTVSGNPYFFQNLPFSLYAFSIIVISLFSKNKKAYQILLVILFVLSSLLVLNLEFVNSIINNTEGMLKTINWSNAKNSFPVLHGLLFIITSNLILKKIKYFIYPIIFIALVSSQISTSIIPLGKHFLSFNDLNTKQKKQLTQSFHNQEYALLIKEMIELKKNKTKHFNHGFKSKYTFKGYYDYENYKFIKSLVGESRTVSIGLDPMVAVMNNIKVIGGYHNLYTLSYKLKFRKVIEKQLNDSEMIKKYYDLWGNRLYTFVENSSSIKTDFREAKLLGAEYVISKFPISNEILLPVCEKCNNTPKLFLYKIDFS